MPNPETTEKAKEDLREGKSPSTAAGEFVHEEIEHVREGKHGARSPQQAIAIGLSEARRAGIPLKPSKKGSASVKKKAERDYEKGQSGTEKKDVAAAVGGTQAGDEKRAEVDGVASGAVEANKDSGKEADREQPSCSRKESGADEAQDRIAERGEEGGADPYTAQQQRRLEELVGTAEFALKA